MTRSAKKLAADYDFDWDQVERLNVKAHFQVQLRDGEMINIPLENLDFMKRVGCRYCGDYSAEFADISFGGIGAREGWTTAIIRTPLGRAAFADARDKTIEEMTHDEDETFASHALSLVRGWSARKKKMARQNRRENGKTGVTVVS